MEEQDRKKILKNMNYLVENTKDFQKIFDYLDKNKMFNKFMKQEILGKRPEDRLEFLYAYVTTRGPKAFRILCQAFKETRQPHLAGVLNRDSVQNMGASVFVSGNASTELTLDEEYPFCEEWKVTKGFERFDLDISNVYKMSTKPKGLALIINIPKFINDTYDERLGSDQDIKRLESIFEQLDYELVVHNDTSLTASKIMDIVTNFAGQSEHRFYDSSVVFMMSHGRDDECSHTLNIVAADSQLVNSDWVVEQLSAIKCKGLQGKPKLFFFQACRGETYQYPIAYDDEPSPHEEKPKEELLIEKLSHMDMDVSPSEVDGAPPKKPVKSGRADSDCIIGYATTHGHVAMRDAERGSWYIQILCQVIAKHAWNKDIYTILQKVRRFEDGKFKSYTKPQGSNKRLYFQPGLFDQSNYASNGTS